jgi:hypothetical protein
LAIASIAATTLLSGAARFDRGDQGAVVLVGIELQPDATAGQIEAGQHRGDALRGGHLRGVVGLQPDLAQRSAGLRAPRESARLADGGDESLPPFDS